MRFAPSVVSRMLAVPVFGIGVAAAMPQGEVTPRIAPAQGVRALSASADAARPEGSGVAAGVIGAPIALPVSGLIQPAEGADLAYDPTHDVFALVLCEEDLFSAQWTSGLRLSRAGASMEFMLVEGETYRYSSGARVVGIAAREAFVVVWDEVGKSWNGMVGATFRADSGLYAVDEQSVGSSSAAASWALSGDPRGFSDQAVVVARLGNTLFARTLTVDASLELGVGQQVPITSGATVTGVPAISRSRDASGRRLVVYQNGGDVHGTIIDGGLQVVDAGPIAAGPATERAPAVDGDGSKWLVAYTEGGGAATTVRCRGVYWNSSLATAWVGPERIVATANATGLWVAGSGDSYLLGYTVGTVRHLWSIDAFSCLPCEGEVLVTPAEAGYDLRMAIARAEGSSEPAMVCGGTTLYPYRVDDGITTDLGGGCGGGGKAEASCARIGNPSFELNLWDARATTPAFLVLSAGRSDLTCGACTIVPDLGLGVVLGAGNTDALGNASLGLALPGDPTLIGAVLYEQWLLLSGSGCLGALETSRARRVQLQ
jgi:hypothetical protein